MEDIFTDKRVALFIVGALAYLIKNGHTQAMIKLDVLIQAVNNMGIKLEIHDEKLKIGKEEFKKIEEHQLAQDNKIESIDKRLIRIEERKD